MLILYMIWSFRSPDKLADNVLRVADGRPAHKYRKLYEKGGLAATRCYVKRRLAKYMLARLRHTLFFPGMGSPEKKINPCHVGSATTDLKTKKRKPIVLSEIVS